MKHRIFSLVIVFFLAEVISVFFPKRALAASCGINIDPTNGAGYPSSDSLPGVDWVRIEYKDCTKNSPAQESVDVYRGVLSEYKNAGIKTLVILDYMTYPGAFNDLEGFAERTAYINGELGSLIDAYEIWNEPDIDKFLSPPSAAALAPLLKVAYPIIKKNAPDSTVLNGPIGNIRTTAFVKDLYAQAGDYFDELSVHAYYCDEYVRDGNVSVLVSDFNDIANARPLNKRSGKIWITELGCSMESSSVDETVQKNHNAVATQALLATGKVRLIQLYTIINRPDQNEHEANFGLLYDDGREKQSWQWYEALPSK